MSDKLQEIRGTDSLRKYFDSAYTGVYAFDDGAEPILTVARVMQGKVTLDGGRKEEHVILEFSERSVQGMCEVKPLILNATNQKTLEKLYGKGADALGGKQIQLYVDPAVKAIGGGTTEGIRIRPFKPRPVAAAPIPPCTDCNGEIVPAMGKTADFMVKYTMKNYGVPLCAECAGKRKAAAVAAERGATEGEPGAVVEDEQLADRADTPAGEEPTHDD